MNTKRKSEMERILLYDEYRLIERRDSEVHAAWKGAHLLFFFLAFVFGSFCTFCFHVMMYLFDEKCVLFPKLLSHASLRHSVMNEFISPDEEKPTDNSSNAVPVDFLSTQWVERSACYLPTYVPLVSGICGLVWTTMFLMCSTGSRTLTGLQRPWRILPLVFVFSLTLGSVCVYSSTITHYGLNELCRKLGEITGTTTCTYTINVATLAYSRRIHGVYQATQLTIISAWLHTSCWLLSALLALARVLLVIDFQLVRVSAHLQGNFDKMLERHEKQLQTVTPDITLWKNNKIRLRTSPGFSPSASQSTIKDIHELNEDDSSYLTISPSDILYFSLEHPGDSDLSLVLEERNKLARLKAYESVAPDSKFIVEMLYDLTEAIDLPDSISLTSSSSHMVSDSSRTLKIVRQFGKAKITQSHDVISNVLPTGSQRMEKEKVVKEVTRDTRPFFNKKPSLPLLQPSTSRKTGHFTFQSSMNITSDIKLTLQRKRKTGHPEKKMNSSLKHIGVQTAKKKLKKRGYNQKVQISDSKHVYTFNDKISGKTDNQNNKTPLSSKTREKASKEILIETNQEVNKEMIIEAEKSINKSTKKIPNNVVKETEEDVDDTSKIDKKEKQD